MVSTKNLVRQLEIRLKLLPTGKGLLPECLVHTLAIPDARQAWVEAQGVGQEFWRERERTCGNYNLLFLGATYFCPVCTAQYTAGKSDMLRQANGNEAWLVCCGLLSRRVTGAVAQAVLERRKWLPSAACGTVLHFSACPSLWAPHSLCVWP